MAHARLKLLPGAPESGASALALARAAGISLAAAKALLAAPRVVPRALAVPDAERAQVLLRAAKIPCELEPGAPKASRCPAHPELEDGGRCDRCGARICDVCALQAGRQRCPTCAREESGRRGPFALRVSALLVVLTAVGGWALAVERRRAARTLWDRTLDVAVVELVERGASVSSPDPLASALPQLEARMATEMHRFRQGPPPFEFTLLGPVALEALPALPPTGAELATRARYAADLRTLREQLSSQLGQPLARFDVVLYLRMHPTAEGEPRVVEGAGAAGGEYGMVDSPVAERGSPLTCLALVHELLHCLGASDKYDDAGHATRGGLVDPELGLPQREAEVMVGEVPLGVASGRLPGSLDEIGVGPETAREIRWR